MRFIYKLTSPSGKIYIGQSSTSVQSQWETHIKESRRLYTGPNKILYKAIRKHGYKHFLVETLEECEDKDLETKQVQYILQYCSQVPYGLNADLGLQMNPENLVKPVKQQLPIYLQVHRNGYRVKYPGHKHKYFVSRTISNEELLKNALEFLERLKSTSDVQRLNGSGESLRIS